MSGVVFNIINNVPFVGTGNNGELEWVSGEVKFLKIF